MTARKDLVFAAFKAESTFYERKNVSQIEFWKRLRSVTTIKNLRLKSAASGKRPYGVTFPPVETCREDFKAGTHISQWTFEE